MCESIVKARPRPPKKKRSGGEGGRVYHRTERRSSLRSYCGLISLLDMDTLTLIVWHARAGPPGEDEDKRAQVNDDPVNDDDDTDDDDGEPDDKKHDSIRNIRATCKTLKLAVDCNVCRLQKTIVEKVGWHLGNVELCAQGWRRKCASLCWRLAAQYTADEYYSRMCTAEYAALFMLDQFEKTTDEISNLYKRYAFHSVLRAPLRAAMAYLVQLGIHNDPFRVGVETDYGGTLNGSALEELTSYDGRERFYSMPCVPAALSMSEIAHFAYLMLGEVLSMPDNWPQLEYDPFSQPASHPTGRMAWYERVHYSNGAHSLWELRPQFDMAATAVAHTLCMEEGIINLNLRLLDADFKSCEIKQTAQAESRPSIS